MITLKTLYEATAQQVFDQVAKHLLTQGLPSYNESEQCAYRGRGGLKCAAGCLIADDEYSRGMDAGEHGDGITWFGLVRNGKAPSDQAQLIMGLQDIHDASNPEEWPESLCELAQDHGLDPAVLEQFTHKEA